MTWITSILLRGKRTRRSVPPCISEPFNTRMIPPTATTRFGSSRMGTMMRSSASRSRTESASTTQTYGEFAAFKPAFTASALLPPGSLSTTRSLVSTSLRYSPRTSALLTSGMYTARTSRNRNSSRISSRVRSSDPSLTTMTSSSG